MEEVCQAGRGCAPFAAAAWKLYFVGCFSAFALIAAALFGGNWLPAVFQSCCSMAYLLRGNIHREGFVIGGGGKGQRSKFGAGRGGVYVAEEGGGEEAQEDCKG
jgi:hypothetical protein